ncbi:MAG: hypothetical protein GX029_07660 [Pseudomonadaceae bacterium]|nr:hypothetical protein [Pseudomonadaceae bacterium]
MQFFFKKILILSLSVTLVGCLAQHKPLQGQQSQPVSSQRPAWINNPQIAGETVGLGHSGLHFNGRAAQRELATRRALDEIARQMGVTVSNATIINQQLTGAGASTSMTGTSFQSVDGRVVNAVVHGEWQESDNFYILMIAR